MPPDVHIPPSSYLSFLDPEDQQELYVKVMTTKLTPERKAQLEHHREVAERMLRGEFVSFPFPRPR
ncbi:protein of unknown function [Pararobbsia alpina]